MTSTFVMATAGDHGSGPSASVTAAFIAHPPLGASIGPAVVARDRGERIADGAQIPADAADGPSDRIATGDGHRHADEQSRDWQVFDPAQRHRSYPLC